MNKQDEQQQAITHHRGPMMVLAGPGSGKTTVIVARTQWLIEKAGVDPAKILVVTFTKAAATEMSQRFKNKVGRNLPVWFGTFHSVFFTILKYAYGFTGENILKEPHRVEIFREIIHQVDIEVEDEGQLISDLTTEISLVKGGMMSLEHYYATSCAADVFREVFNKYNQALARHQWIDFDDMLVYTYELFKQRPDILKGWQQRFEYILVDEFQDINLLQYLIIRMLAKPEDNLFIVGDDDQSIYRFRGAKPEIMLNFKKDFPLCKEARLEINYRSTGAIVESAGRVIKNNKNRFDKQIKAHKDQGEPVIIKAFENIGDENRSIIRDIKDYCENKGVPLSEIAVLYRTNTQPRPLIEGLMAYNIPFRMKDKIPNIYEHWITKNLVAYMKIAMGGRDRGDFLQIINRPNRYVNRQAFETPVVSLTALRDYYAGKEWMTERLDSLYQDLKMLDKMAPYGAIKYIRHGIGYENYIKTYAEYRKMKPEDLIEVLDEIQESAKDFKTCQEWFDHMETYTRQLKIRMDNRQMELRPCVSIATMHSAKGLEYQVVFIPDANEKVIPHQKAMTQGDVEEERRMFYVAMTRAKSALHIYFVRNRHDKEMEMSRFLGEILLDRQNLIPGKKVVHQIFGPGIIKEVGDQALVIQFEKLQDAKKLDIGFCISRNLLKVL